MPKAEDGICEHFDCPAPDCDSSGEAEADSTSETTGLSHCMNPNTFAKHPQHIASVLHQMASGEGCDGEPYDQMQQAGDYINFLEDQLAQAQADLANRADDLHQIREMQAQLAQAIKERDGLAKDRTEMADELEKCAVTMGKGMDAIDRLEQQLATATEALEEAIKWDGCDDHGEPAVWLEQAEQALAAIKENQKVKP